VPSGKKRPRGTISRWAESANTLRTDGLVDGADGGAVFVFGQATFAFATEDEVGRRLAAVQLVATEIASASAVAAEFGIGLTTLWRWKAAHDARSARTEMSIEDRRPFVHEVAQRLPEPAIDYVRLQISAVRA